MGFVIPDSALYLVRHSKYSYLETSHVRDVGTISRGR